MPLDRRVLTSPGDGTQSGPYGISNYLYLNGGTVAVTTVAIGWG